MHLDCWKHHRGVAGNAYKWMYASQAAPDGGTAKAAHAKSIYTNAAQACGLMQPEFLKWGLCARLLPHKDGSRVTMPLQPAKRIWYADGTYPSGQRPNVHNLLYTHADPAHYTRLHMATPSHSMFASFHRLISYCAGAQAISQPTSDSSLTYWTCRSRAAWLDTKAVVASGATFAGHLDL